MDSSIYEFGHIHCCKRGFQSKINDKMANSVDPNETARYQPSYLDLHCLQRYLNWSVGMKRSSQSFCEQAVTCLDYPNTQADKFWS